jgi:metal-responsive CopG/Arc/MetJ family transcriptional regulator
MNRATIAITLEQHLFERLNQLISAHLYPNLNRVIHEAIEEKLQRLEERNRLAQA